MTPNRKEMPVIVSNERYGQIEEELRKVSNNGDE